MNHRNKIQLLVTTPDPADAPDCITEYCPLPVNMAIYAISQPNFQNIQVACGLESKLHLAFLVRPEPPNSMPATAEYGQQRINLEMRPC